MKTIKFLTSMLFAVLMAAILAYTFQLPLLPVAAVLMVLSCVIKSPVGAFGEFLAIEATDSAETKSAKETFNRIHADLESKGNRNKKELEVEFKAEIKKAIEQNSELKEQLTASLKEIEEKQLTHEEAILEINRFRSAAQANEAKGISFSDAFNKGIDEHQDAIKKFAEKKGAPVSFELKAVGDMGLSSISNLTTANVQTAAGIIPYPNRKVHMRDILATGRMSTSLFNFLKEIGFDGSVASWQENSGAKPQFDIRYTEASAPSQFIAGYIKISRKSLDDIPALKSSLASRLLQAYLDAEDAQVLNGSGANGQILGLYNSANSLTYTPGRTKSVEMIVDAMSVIEELNHDATGILVRPRGFNDLMLSQSQGTTTGIYSLPGQGFVNYQGNQLTIAGVPIWKSTAQVDNTFLTGDFDKGAQILFREDPIVEFFEQDGDNVKNNQITVRVEGRIALPVYYNDAFIHGTFVNPGS